MSPPPCGRPKGKIQILHLEGGSPEAAVDGAAVYGRVAKTGHRNFLERFPLRGAHRKFHERSAPRNRGRPTVQQKISRALRP